VNRQDSGPEHPRLAEEGIVSFLHSKRAFAVWDRWPTLGGTDPEKALQTYWALGTRGMVGVEYLTNLEQIPERAYFVFARQDSEPSWRTRKSHRALLRAASYPASHAGFTVPLVCRR